MHSWQHSKTERDQDARRSESGCESVGVWFQAGEVEEAGAGGVGWDDEDIVFSWWEAGAAGSLWVLAVWRGWWRWSVHGGLSAWVLKSVVALV